jgi:hypothetical protein
VQRFDTKEYRADRSNSRRISDLQRRVVRVAILAVNATDFAEGSGEPQA